MLILGLLLILDTGRLAAEDLDAVLAESTKALSLFTFDVPQTGFRQVRTGTPMGSPAWQQATFGLATCLHQQMPFAAERIAEAKALYEELARTCPTSKWATRAVLDLGRIAELRDGGGDLPDLASARRRYQEVINRWPDQPIAGEAALRLASAWFQEDTPAGRANALSGLLAWVTAHPTDPLAAADWQWLGDRHVETGAWQEAYDCFAHTDALGSLWRGREQILWWRLAVLAEEHLHDKPSAIRWYTRICREAQTSGKAFEAQMALARLGAPVPALTAFASWEGTPPIAATAKPVADQAPAIAPGSPAHVR